MKFQKTVWFEGMKLDPHHFQQADRYNSYNLNSRISFINSNLWGIKELQFDNAALAGGTFGLIKGKGIMPDGLIFNMPDNDSLPKSRDFEKFFSAVAEHLEVFLAIPNENTAGNNCQIEDSQNNNNTRFSMQNIDLLDYNSGVNMRSIGTAKPNFQFKFGNESLEDFVFIKLGNIIRSSEGKYILDKNYIPPSISISASETLTEYTRNILSSLVSKSKELRDQAGLQKPELSLTHVEILMMLQTINTFLPILNYYHSVASIHPENLYLLLLSLAGQLSTYSNLGAKTSDLPVYDHKHLSEIFSQLENEIKILLGIQKTITRKDVIIPLRKQGDSLYIGQLSPGQLSAQFFIAVHGDMSDKKIITELPKNIRISAYEEIFAVHQAGIQGVTIEHVARPPAGLVSNEKVHYFKINKEGRFWDKITEKNNIAFFVASEFKNLNIDLTILLP